MKSVNEVTLLGYIGKDAEVRFTATGKKVASFTLATTERWGESTNKQEKTSWHRITCWEGLADVAEQYVKKGAPLLVRGKLSYGEYQSRGGEKHTTAEIVAHDLVLLPHVQAQKSNGAAAATSRPAPAARQAAAR